MPRYRTHVRFNLFLLPFVLFSVSFFSFRLESFLFSTAGFLYATFFMNPDVDLSGHIKLFSLKGFFTLPFRIYSMLFKHRGLSHSLFLGSFTRIGYLAALTFAFFSFFHLFTKTDLLANFSEHKNTLFCIFLGVFFSDASHVFLDRFWKEKFR